MKKKIVALLVSSVAVGAFALGASASSTLEEISAYLNKGVKIKLNGLAWTPKDADGNVIYPITYEGTTYLPVRAAGEAIGLKVDWDNDTQTVLLGEKTKDSGEGGSSSTGTVTMNENSLSVTDGKGKNDGYQMLHGYRDEDKYQIYFKGDASSYSTKIEDLRDINLDESITWQHAGKTYRNTRTELYSFFSDTTWFRNNLNGITQYTLTDAWFEEVFGDVYLDWVTGIGYSADAARWVEKYFRQIGQKDQTNFVTLTPDVEVRNVDDRPKESIMKSTNNLDYAISEEEIAFIDMWMEIAELEFLDVTVFRSIDSIEFQINSKTVFTINNVPSNLESGKITVGSGIRYQYLDGKGLLFSRADIFEAGFIN